MEIQGEAKTLNVKYLDDGNIELSIKFESDDTTESLNCTFSPKISMKISILMLILLFKQLGNEEAKRIYDETWNETLSGEK